jgi:integrase
MFAGISALLGRSSGPRLLRLFPFHSHDATAPERTQGNTRAWVARQRGGLAFWGDRLKKRDLRHLDLRDDVLAGLDGPNRTHKIQILKRFLSWLRKEKHILTTSEDVTYGQLSAPQAKPAQWKKSKAIPREHVELALEHLTAPWRDVLTLQAGTGWHISEASRFAEAGAVEPLPRSAKIDGDAAAVLVLGRAKSGEPLRTRVTAAVAEAARRLRTHGVFAERSYYRAIESACRAAGIPPFNPGALRHSVATWAIDSGADPAMVSAFLGHKSISTTRRFYATHAAPARVPTLL